MQLSKQDDTELESPADVNWSAELKRNIITVEELKQFTSSNPAEPDPYEDDKHDKRKGFLSRSPHSVLIVAIEYCVMYCYQRMPIKLFLSHFILAEKFFSRCDSKEATFR